MSPAATPLRKIVTGAVSEAITGTSHDDDDYELLAKGLGAYNQGTGAFSGGSGNAWVNLLVNRPTPSSSAFLQAKAKAYKDRSNSEKRLFAGTEAMRYALSVMHDGNKLGLPYRAYTWQGGTGVDVNGDGTIADIPDNAATPQDESVIETTVPWCFAYGEAEWMTGKEWNEVLKDATGDVITAPVGRVECS